MLKSQGFLLILALLLISLMLSGCYTIIGYPPDAKDTTVTGHKDIYREYYDYDSPFYFGGFYDYPHYLYGWSPYYYDNNYWYHPEWSSNNWYYRDDDSSYVPEKRPEVRKRDATELRRSSSREEQKIEGATQPKGKQESADDGDQKSQRKYRDDHR